MTDKAGQEETEEKQQKVDFFYFYLYKVGRVEYNQTPYCFHKQDSSSNTTHLTVF